MIINAYMIRLNRAMSFKVRLAYRNPPKIFETHLGWALPLKPEYSGQELTGSAHPTLLKIFHK